MTDESAPPEATPGFTFQFRSLPGEDGLLFAIKPDGEIVRGPAFTTVDAASLAFWATLDRMHADRTAAKTTAKSCPRCGSFDPSECPLVPCEWGRSKQPPVRCGVLGHHKDCTCDRAGTTQ